MKTCLTCSLDLSAVLLLLWCDNDPPTLLETCRSVLIKPCYKIWRKLRNICCVLLNVVVWLAILWLPQAPANLCFSAWRCLSVVREDTAADDGVQWSVFHHDQLHQWSVMFKNFANGTFYKQAQKVPETWFLLFRNEH